MFKGDPSQSTKELLDHIKQEAVRGAKDGNLTYMMPAVAALFVKLSEQADRRARIIVRLTIAIAALTIVLVAIEVASLFQQ